MHETVFFKENIALIDLTSYNTTVELYTERLIVKGFTIQCE